MAEATLDTTVVPLQEEDLSDLIAIASEYENSPRRSYGLVDDGWWWRLMDAMEHFNSAPRGESDVSFIELACQEAFTYYALKHRAHLERCNTLASFAAKHGFSVRITP
jgi:hypothetical protein